MKINQATLHVAANLVAAAVWRQYHTDASAVLAGAVAASTALDLSIRYAPTILGFLHGCPPMFADVRRWLTSIVGETIDEVLQKGETMAMQPVGSTPNLAPVAEVAETMEGGKVKKTTTDRLTAQLQREVAAINRTFESFGVNAGTRAKNTHIGGNQVVLYGIKRGTNPKTGNLVAIKAIEKLVPELEEAISTVRKTPTPLRLLAAPLRLEVAHPQRGAIPWADAVVDHAPGCILLGRSYANGASDLWIVLYNAPHILVAGGTRCGKSVAMWNMILSLCWNTAPDNLQLYLIDLKKTDFVPLGALPHVVGAAFELKDAQALIAELAEILHVRQREGVSSPQILVAIDEYTDLVNDEKTVEHLSRLARQGASAGITLLAATQHPTSKALGDSTIKNNFLRRVAGQVADANAASNAAGRPGTGAEKLPGNGSFLYVHGNEIMRLQAFLITDDVCRRMVKNIRRRHDQPVTSSQKSPRMTAYEGDESPRMTAYEPRMTAYEPRMTAYEPRMTAYEAPKSPRMTAYGTAYGTAYEPRTSGRSENNEVFSEVAGKSTKIVFPIGTGRPLTNAEAEAVRKLASAEEFTWRGRVSMRRLIEHVYGSEDPNRRKWVREALDK